MAPADDAAAAVDRDAKIEQLLLTGLDHYFAAQYQQAINVWTRALFLDRSHTRARAYIERARSAMAERQRQSEEMLQHGVEAFSRGEGDEARRLLHAAIDGGAPSEEALAVLGRLNRLEVDPAAAPPPPARVERTRSAVRATPSDTRGGVRRALVSVGVIVIALGAVAAVMFATRGDWPWSADREPIARPPAAAARGVTLPVPRRADAALTRARTLMAGGHLHEALAALDDVRPTDPRRADADRLRGDIQRQLLTVARVP